MTKVEGYACVEYRDVSLWFRERSLTMAFTHKAFNVNLCHPRRCIVRSLVIRLFSYLTKSILPLFYGFYELFLCAQTVPDTCPANYCLF